MGPNETAITIRGGPRVIGVFDVHGCCRAQIKHFWGVLIGSRTAYGLGLMIVSHLRRMRMRLGLPRELDPILWQLLPDALGLRWRARWRAAAPSGFPTRRRTSS